MCPERAAESGAPFLSLACPTLSADCEQGSRRRWNFRNPDRSPNHVRLKQTHTSYVLLAGPYAYKIKKPVNFGFLDFSTLEKRRYFSEREVILNRRLCP
jgi:hypothetical protein